MFQRGEELAALVKVPGGDHVGEIVAVGPEGMGMKIALPPAHGRLLRGRGARVV